VVWLHIISLFGYFQIDDHGLVRFLPLGVSDEESIDNILLQIDAVLHCMFFKDSYSTLCLKKTRKLWDGKAQNYKDRFWWNLAKIFKIL